MAAGASSSVVRSTERSGFISVEIGFMKAVTRSSSPLVTPPSRPPARLVGRRMPRSPGAGVGVGDDLVVHLRSWPARAVDAVADGDGFDRRNRHQRLRQPAVELAIPLGVAPEPDRHVARDHFEGPAQRVAGRAGGVDGRHHLLLERRLGTLQRRVDRNRPHLLP